MDHSGLGVGRRSTLLALSSGAASRATFGGRWFARHRVRSPRAQSGRAQLSSARGVPDSQLVFLHIRDRDGVPVRRRSIARSAAQSRTRAQCAAVTLYAGRRARLFHCEYRNRRFLQHTGRCCVDFSILRKFRARHELQHRMGVVRPSAAHCRNPKTNRADALRRPGIARHHSRETFLSRSFSARSTLSDRCVNRRRRNRHSRVVFVSAVSRRSHEKP